MYKIAYIYMSCLHVMICMMLLIIYTSGSRNFAFNDNDNKKNAIAS